MNMNLQEWLESKKTKDMILVMLVLLIGEAMGMSLEAMAMVAALGGVKIGAQGVADIGKKPPKK